MSFYKSFLDLVEVVFLIYLFFFPYHNLHHSKVFFCGVKREFIRKQRKGHKKLVHYRYTGEALKNAKETKSKPEIPEKF